MGSKNMSTEQNFEYEPVTIEPNDNSWAGTVVYIGELGSMHSKYNAFIILAVGKSQVFMRRIHDESEATYYLHTVAPYMRKPKPNKHDRDSYIGKYEAIEIEPLDQFAVGKTVHLDVWDDGVKVTAVGADSFLGIYWAGKESSFPLGRYFIRKPEVRGKPKPKTKRVALYVVRVKDRYQPSFAMATEEDAKLCLGFYRWPYGEVLEVPDEEGEE